MSEGLKQLRNMMKMTQEELAEKMSVSRQTVAKWENGESVPDVVKCSELAKIFNLSLDEMAASFLKKEEEKPKSSKNRFFFGTCSVANNKLTLPDLALKEFKLQNGDELLLLGDSAQGLLLFSRTGFEAFASQILNSSVFDGDYFKQNDMQAEEND